MTPDARGRLIEGILFFDDLSPAAHAWIKAQHFLPGFWYHESFCVDLRDAARVVTKMKDDGLVLEVKL